MPKYYSGIGSRMTPPIICEVMTQLATLFEKDGYILRSGHAKGADIAFEKGVIDPKNKEIYIPWQGFEGSPSQLYHISDQAMQIAARHHPNWAACTQGARKMHGRNVAQVLGEDCNTLSEFVMCWTPGGDGSGGTGQAIRIANHYSVPVFDLGKTQVLITVCRKYGIPI